jgi:adenine-specific DNA-methyltransferase
LLYFLIEVIIYLEMRTSMHFKEHQTAQKLRGGYYTPEWLTSYLVKWACQDSRATVLEPSCGDGAFIGALGDFAPKSTLSAFELDPEEAEKSRRLATRYTTAGFSVENLDFLVWAEQALVNPHKEFDAVLGNPPYIRYQFMSRETQDSAQRIAALLGMSFTRHTNIWLPFVACGVALARPGGRLAMVIPSEIMTVSYAATLREFLVRECSSIRIIDPTDLWFPGTSQGAIAILCEKRLHANEPFKGISIQSVTGTEFVARSIDELFANTSRVSDVGSGEKWTRALLTNAEFSALTEMTDHSAVHQFKDIAKVEVGIVTGANDFFFVPDAVVSKFGMEAFAKPMIGKTDHVAGIVFDEAQLAHNRAKGYPTAFLAFPGNDHPLSESTVDYIGAGEAEELHRRYKCRIRTTWYQVPSVRPSAISLPKRAHLGGKLIFNASEVYTTDTFYRVTSKIEAGKLVSSYVNPLTALSSELMGRSYGGGVLELVPSEVARISIPISTSSAEDLATLNRAFIADGYDAFCTRRGEVIFKELGFGQNLTARISEAWLRLRARRFRVSDPDDEHERLAA